MTSQRPIGLNAAMKRHKVGGLLALWLMASATIPAQNSWHPPRLPGGQAVVTDRSSDFLKPIGPLAAGVTIATTPPTIDFLYYSQSNKTDHATCPIFRHND